MICIFVYLNLYLYCNKCYSDAIKLKKKTFLSILFKRDYRLFGKYLGFSLAQSEISGLACV